MINPDNKTIQVTLPKVLIAHLDDICKRHNISKSQLIKILIDGAIIRAIKRRENGEDESD